MKSMISMVRGSLIKLIRVFFYNLDRLGRTKVDTESTVRARPIINEIVFLMKKNAVFGANDPTNITFYTFGVNL